MTSKKDYEQTMSTWLDERAQPRAPDGLLERVTERTASTAPRPAWRIPSWWFRLPGRQSPGTTWRLKMIPTFSVAASAIAVAAALALSNSGLLGPQEEPRLVPAGADTAAVTGVTHIVGPEGDLGTISAALEFAQDGDEILVQPGFYPESLTITKDITLRGDGTAAHVVIEYGPGSPTITHPLWFVDLPNGISLEGSDATIRDLTLAGPRQSIAIDIAGGSPTLEGLVVDLGPKPPTVSDDYRESFHIRDGADATIRDSAWDGLLWVHPGASAALDGNTITNTFTYFEGSASASLTDNTFVDSNLLRFDAGANGVVADSDFGVGGVEVVGGSTVVVRGNEFPGPLDAEELEAAIVVDGSGSSAEVVGNTVTQAPIGIRVGSDAKAIVTNNTIDSNEVGIEIQIAAAAAVADNQFCSNGQHLVDQTRAEDPPGLEDNTVCDAE